MKQNDNETKWQGNKMTMKQHDNEIMTPPMIMKRIEHEIWNSQMEMIQNGNETEWQWNKITMK